MTTKHKKVRLQDIAERANLSVSAVSLALRGHPSISEESKRRIEKIRRELGYRPAGNLHTANAHRQTLRIAYCLVEESLQDEAYTPIVHGVITACRAWKAHLAIEQIPSRNAPFPTIRMPAGEDPDGFLLIGFLTDELVEHFVESGKPVVLLGSNPLKKPYTVISADIYGAGETVARRAIAEGHRNFVNVAANMTSLHNRLFLAGVRRVLREHALELRDDHVVVGPEYRLHEPQFLDFLVDLMGEPTAIVAAGSVSADAYCAVLHAKGWMEEKKITIYAPRQSGSGRVNPHFHSLNLGFERIGQIGVDRLVQRLSGYQTCDEPATTTVSALGWLDAGAVPDRPSPAPSLPPD